MSGWPDASLPFRVGEICVAVDAAGEFSVSHREDAALDNLEIFRDPEAAVEIARFDDARAFRPLKTAPNLQHGWRMLLADFAQVRRALEYFYPGRAAVFAAWQKNELIPTPLRETLSRQTGMYRVAAKISDAAAAEVSAKICRSDGGCLRTILWARAVAGLPPEKFDPAKEARPLLCQEACNLLVAEMRQAVKNSPNE